MLGRPELCWYCVFLSNHTPIDTQVLDACIRISGNDARKGVDVPPPIPVVPERRRELREVDVVSFDDILFDRPG